MAEAGASTQGCAAPPSKTTISKDSTQEDDHQQDIVDWDFIDEDALPEGSNLSSNKALMEQYPEDETNSKKTKKTNTGKGEKGDLKHKE